jgi:hypothetical protein
MSMLHLVRSAEAPASRRLVESSLRELRERCPDVVVGGRLVEDRGRALLGRRNG